MCQESIRAPTPTPLGDRDAVTKDDDDDYGDNDYGVLSVNCLVSVFTRDIYVTGCTV